MNTLLHPSHLKALYLIFWIALYGGVELGCMDFWDDFKLLREFWFLSEPLARLCLIAFVLMAAISSLWFAIQRYIVIYTMRSKCSLIPLTR